MIKRILTFGAMLLLITAMISCSSQAEESKSTATCIIETSHGDITVDLYGNRAPITVKNFLRYVDSKRYDNTSFIRTCTPENESERDVKIVVIQSDTLSPELCYDPIQIETTKQTGLLHRDGAISMARSEPNSASASYFISIGDQPSLDYGGARNPDGYGFAVFGQVTKGMDIVKEINREEEKGQYFTTPVKILRVYRTAP